MQFSMKVSAAAVVVAGILASASTANAFGWHLDRAPEQPRIERFINHYVYKPRYVHMYHMHGDPYAYRYAPRAYYPYHGSQYWVDAQQMKHRHRYHWTGPKIVYQPSWGRPQHEHAHERVHQHVPSKPTK